MRCEESATPRHYVLWLGRNAACELRLNAKQIRKIEYINGRRVPRPFSPSILTPEKKKPLKIEFLFIDFYKRARLPGLLTKRLPLVLSSIGVMAFLLV